MQSGTCREDGSMNSIQRSAGIAFLTVASLGMIVIAEGPAELVVRHIAVVDGAGRLLPDRDIVVRGTRIATLAPAGLPLPPAKTLIEGSGKFAIAGLVDADARVAAFTPAAAQALLARGVTTIADRSGNPARLERWRQDLASGRAYAPKLAPACGQEGGVAAASAPDALDAVHDALARLVAAGRSPSEAIATFTRDNARALCLDAAGVIAPGHAADFLVLSANPLRDIRASRAIDAVVFRGEVLTQAHIRMLSRGTLPPPTPPKAGR
jgi:adenine deaminase